MQRMQKRVHGRLFQSTVVAVGALLLAGIVQGAATSVTLTPQAAAQAAQRTSFFSETGYRIADDRFLAYFEAHGGLVTFGYPTSRRFLLLGSTVQFFQRHILQLQPNGDVGLINLLDEGFLEVAGFGDATIPAYDPVLAAAAPSPDTPEYGEAVGAFITARVPNRWEGLPVHFLDAFLAPGSASGEEDPLLQILAGLEMLGFPTSQPALDPYNPGFVYQRFQRGALHFDATRGQTRPLLLADYLKHLITGQNVLPPFLAEAVGSRFYLQYDPSQPLWLVRPELLPGSDLTQAFEAEGASSPGSLPASSPASGALPRGPGASPSPIERASPRATLTPVSVGPTPSPLSLTTATVTANPNPPEINALDPSTLPVGNDLVIRGTAFGSQPGQILFSGKLATALIWSDTSIIVTVPQGTLDGKLRVRRVDGVFSNAVDFKISPTPAPTNTPAATVTPTSTGTATSTQTPTVTSTPSPPVVTMLSAGSGRVGDSVIISGRNFGETRGSVFFGNTAVNDAFVTRYGDTAVVAQVPQREAGTVAVRVLTTGGQLSNGGCFTVISAGAATATPGAAVPTETPAGGCA